MSLRIIAGTLKGRVIPSPSGDATRPTTDMWRSTIFSALEHLTDKNDYDALDLFCGTGSLGLEALSRGAATCVFIDQASGIVRSLEHLLKEFDVADKTTVMQMKLDPTTNLPVGPFDVIFVDAPYKLRMCGAIADLIAKNAVLRPNGLLVLEHGTSEFLAPRAPYKSVWTKEKGDTVVDILRWEPQQL